MIARAREWLDVPIADYCTSGETDTLLAESAGDVSTRTGLMLGILTCITRAGADSIVTYFAKDPARASENRRI